MIVCATGHRPDKLGGYNSAVTLALNEFAVRSVQSIKPDGMIVGMALGWDMAVAVACVRCGIPFTAAIPFEGQESRWPKEKQQDYKNLLKAASFVHVVCHKDQITESGIPWAMQARNEWMVDNSKGVLALWNGDRTGGTANCIKYAKEGARAITNVWPAWEDWFDRGMYLI